MTLAELKQDDIIRITGTPSSGCDRRLVDFEAVVATVSPDGSVKVWPRSVTDPKLTAEEHFHGKLWFQAAESVTLIQCYEY